MRVYYIKDRSIIYIITAIFCLLLIFIGVKIIGNIKSDETTQKTIDVVEVFSGDKKEVKIEEDTNVEIQNPNFLMMILSRSNSFIRSIYDGKYKSENILSQIKDNYMVDIVIDQEILKTQLPAIMSMTNIKDLKVDTDFKLANRGDDKDSIYEELETISELEVESSYSPLGNISFVDNTTEGEAITTAAAGISREDAFKAVAGIAKPKAISVEKNKPYILIYHTHATEAYLPEEDFRSEDKKYNVLGIGDILEEELKKKGHGVTHIETFHDLPSFNQSYSKSLSSMKSALNKEDNLTVLLDLHRDGIASSASYYDKAKKESVIEINGKRVATFKMVIGNGTPNKEKILQFSNYIKTVSDMLYPGLCLKHVIKPYGKYNQYLSDYTLLLEVGSNLNTVEETEETAKLLAEILDVALKGITE